ncbi:MAG TPA: hypothetical protein VF003_18810 [Pseudonocardiaceae bacterium]
MRSPSPPASATTVASPLAQSRPQLLPFAVIGVLCVIAGGLLAAATAPRAGEHTTWAAAYLVLVGDVAQVGLGFGQAMFTARTSTPVLAGQVGGWNLGNAAVLAGTLLGITALVDLGGALLVVTLGLLARGLSPAGVRPVRGAGRWFLYGYRVLVLILFVSIPVGLVLAQIRT